LTDSPKEDAARALAAELAARAQTTDAPIRTTLRELRSTLGNQRMTLARRQQLESALRQAGLDPPSLDTVELDEPLTIVRRPLPSRWTRWRRHPVPRTSKQIVVFVVAVMTFAVTVNEFLPMVHHASPEPMTGDLNIAVARASGGIDVEAGDALAASLRRTIGGLVRAAPGRGGGGVQPDVEVSGPERSDIGADASVEARTGQAAALAARRKADVVVYVRVARRGSQTLIVPALYLSATRLAGAEELAGTYELAPIDIGSVPVDSAIAARAQVRQAVSEQVRGLLDLSYGTSLFAQRDWQAARLRLQAAARTWDAGAPGALVQVFLGNIAGQLADLDGAADAYNNALRLDPRFHRARFGLAEVSLHRAEGKCERRSDAIALRSAARRFAALPDVETRPTTLPGDAYSLRAWLGRGRVDMCLSQIGVADRWAAARASFHHVLDLAAPHDDRFATEQAEAHAGLGLAAMPTGPDAPGARAAYIEALRQYRLAEQTPLPERRRVFRAFMVHIERRLDNANDKRRIR
jgi:tetratricopeptide (TPR) repeat protein